MNQNVTLLDLDLSVDRTASSSKCM